MRSDRRHFRRPQKEDAPVQQTEERAPKKNFRPKRREVKESPEEKPAEGAATEVKRRRPNKKRYYKKNRRTNVEKPAEEKPVEEKPEEKPTEEKKPVEEKPADSPAKVDA